MFYWLTSTERLAPLCWTLSSIVRNRGWNGPLWNSVCESRGAPAKELAWANMGLGFRRPTHRASETQILRSELESLWTYRLLCEICERVTSAVSSICRHHAIQWGHEVACEFVKMFSDVMQYEGNFGKLDWWVTETLIMAARDYRGTCHFIDFTREKQQLFRQSGGWWNVEYFQTLWSNVAGATS